MNVESLKANVWAAILVELNRQGGPRGTIDVESLTDVVLEATRPPVVTDEVVERVARAITAKRRGVAHPFDPRVDYYWKENAPEARAAIDAMPAVVTDDSPSDR